MQQRDKNACATQWERVQGGRRRGKVESRERELVTAEATVGDKRLRIDNGQMRETARTVMGTALMRRR